MESADFTFPSKITHYAAHDLRIVSPSIPCVVESPFAAVTAFYDVHQPREIAEAVRRAAEAISERPSPVGVLAELDTAFRGDASALLDTVVTVNQTTARPFSRIWHRCRPERAWWSNLDMVEGCACGAVRVNGQRWVKTTSSR